MRHRDITARHHVDLVRKGLESPFTHLYFPTDAEFVPHQLQLIRPSGTGTQVSLYDISSRSEQVLEDQRTQIEGIAVSPDGRLVASGTQDGNFAFGTFDIAPSYLSMLRKLA